MRRSRRFRRFPLGGRFDDGVLEVGDTCGCIFMMGVLEAEGHLDTWAYEKEEMGMDLVEVEGWKS